MFKIATLEAKKHKKVSVVFDEGLQRICYNELEDPVEIGKVFHLFLQKLNLPRRLSNNNAGKLRLESLFCIRKD